MKKWMQQYSWQQKSKWLWWGALIFLFLVYQASVKQTLAVRRTYLQAQQALMETAQQEQELQRLKARADRLKVGPSDAAQSSGDPKVYQLSLVSGAAEQQQLLIKSVPATQTVSADGLAVHYDEYQVVGSYDRLLQCWYELEKGKELNLIHVAFKRVVQPQTKASELNMYLTTAYVGGE